MDYVAVLVACSLVGLVLWAAPRALAHGPLGRPRLGTTSNDPAAVPLEVAPAVAAARADAASPTDRVKPATRMLGYTAASAVPEGDGPEGEGPGWFGPYRLEALIGRGAMGEVWRAYDSRRARQVALKLLPTHPPVGSTQAEDTAAAGARMYREARLAGALCSAHVIPVHDFGHINGAAFLDMRLVAGGDLAALLAHHPHGLHPHRAAVIVTQIADALDAAHRAGLVHGDVKPANVLLEPTSRGEFCYLADFGIATAITPTRGAAPRTSLRGTPGYIAPELFTGADPTPAADVYALGVLLHELLSGHLPVPSQCGSRSGAPHATPISPALDRVMCTALAADPADRYATAGALAAAAAHATDTESPLAPPTVWHEDPTRRHHRLPAQGAGHRPADSFDGVFVPRPATPAAVVPAVHAVHSAARPAA